MNANEYFHSKSLYKQTISEEESIWNAIVVFDEKGIDRNVLQINREVANECCDCLPFDVPHHEYCTTTLCIGE
jgi:hypothetical protein